MTMLRLGPAPEGFTPSELPVEYFRQEEAA